jgi:ketosteroid isomerase-like protein
MAPGAEELSNVEIARRGFEAVLRGDLEMVREFLDPDVSWHGGDPSAVGACHNRDQTLAFMARGRFRNARPELVEIVDAGDKVVVVIRTPDPDRSAGSAMHANLTTFRDGRAVEMVHYDRVEDAIAAAELA